MNKWILFKKVKIVSDQLTMRDPFLYNLLKKEKDELSCDISFVFSNNEKKQLSKYIKSN